MDRKKTSLSPETFDNQVINHCLHASKKALFRSQKREKKNTFPGIVTVVTKITSVFILKNTIHTGFQISKFSIIL